MLGCLQRWPSCLFDQMKFSCNQNYLPTSLFSSTGTVTLDLEQDLDLQVSPNLKSDWRKYFHEDNFYVLTKSDLERRGDCNLLDCTSSDEWRRPGQLESSNYHHNTNYHHNNNDNDNHNISNCKLHVLHKQTWTIGVQQIQGAEQAMSGGAPKTRGLRTTIMLM